MKQIKARTSKGAGGPKINPPSSGPERSHKVAFVGTIKSITTVIDAVGDKVGKITITFRPEGNVIADLDAIHCPDKEIFVVIAAKAE